jgi:hypothetical protein
MIEPNTGELSFSDEVKIGPALKRNSFMKLSLAYKLVRSSPEVSLFIYQLPPQCSSGHSIDVVIHYRNDRLVLAFLYLDDDLHGGASSESSEAQELERKKVHDKWLSETLGPKHEYRYPWGKVESVYNDNTVSSYIIIKYEPA